MELELMEKYITIDNGTLRRITDLNVKNEVSKNAEKIIETLASPEPNYKFCATPAHFLEFIGLNPKSFPKPPEIRFTKKENPGARMGQLLNHFIDHYKNNTSQKFLEQKAEDQLTHVNNTKLAIDLYNRLIADSLKDLNFVSNVAMHLAFHHFNCMRWESLDIKNIDFTNIDLKRRSKNSYLRTGLLHTLLSEMIIQRNLGFSVPISKALCRIAIEEHQKSFAEHLPDNVLSDAKFRNHEDDVDIALMDGVLFGFPTISSSLIAITNDPEKKMINRLQVCKLVLDSWQQLNGIESKPLVNTNFGRLIILNDNFKIEQNIDVNLI